MVVACGEGEDKKGRLPDEAKHEWKEGGRTPKAGKKEIIWG
jgi:hypothetical protein